MGLLHDLSSPVALAVALGFLQGCTPTVVEPAPKLGAAVITKPVPLAGLGTATNWANGVMVVDPPKDCPHDKEALESALGLEEPTGCAKVRQKGAPAIGDGDAPIGPAIAPHCYVSGNVIIVVQYEEPTTACTRVVGLAVLPKK